MPNSRIVNTSILNGYQAYWTWVKMNLREASQEEVGSATDWYLLMEAYYLNNGLYDVLRDFWGTEVGIPANVKSIRNPAFRAVQFHVTHLWPGSLPEALPILTDNATLLEPIEKIWRWSNWASQKQVAARYAAMYGDLFIKVGHKSTLQVLETPRGRELSFDQPTKVILQLIDPQHVTELDYDNFGVVTWLRMDVPSGERDPATGKLSDFTHVEVWNLDGVRVWKDDQSRTARPPLDQLGEPTVYIPLDQMGLDFIPIVWQPFLDLGKGRGLNAFGAALEKIDEANRMASRLHQMIFRYNRPLWALESNHVDQMGAPLPPPRVGTNTSSQIELGDDSVMPLPGNTKLSPLVPALDYASLIQAVSAQMEELEADLPEMTYYNMRQYSGELSGKALQLRLSAAVDKVLEARGNLETGLQRAVKMALTLGKKLWDQDLGSYEDGDFEHQYADRPVIPLSESERSQIFQLYRSGDLPIAAALTFAGKSEDQIDDVLAEVKKEQSAQQKSLSQAVLNAQRAMNQPPDDGEDDNAPSTGSSSTGSPVPSPTGG